MKDVIIQNGRIVTADDTYRGDLLVADGKIVRIGGRIERSGAETVDAAGKYVLPGGVDVHTHLNLSTGGVRVGDGFFAGTASAAFGGTTCVVEHPGFGPPGCPLRHQVDAYLRDARDQAVVDYGLHAVVQDAGDGVLAEMSELARMGVSSAKVYTTYDGRLDDGQILRVLDRAGGLGLLIAFHAENDAVIAFLRRRFRGQGHLSPAYHPLSRPDFCEAEAIHGVLALARAVGDVPVYIVHLSTASGLGRIEAARENGQTVHAEVCPQHLILEDSCYDLPAPDGLKCIMSPPARKRADREALWRGLARGSIHVVATDHCAFTLADKLALGRGDFTRCPGGIPGVETRLPLMHAEGVLKGRLTLNRFVDVVSTTPAKIMGLYPTKGALAPGADADVVVFDPDLEKTLTPANLYHPADYSPFEGMRVRGWPTLTMVRGRVVMRDNRLLAEKGWGRYVERGPSTHRSG